LFTNMRVRDLNWMRVEEYLRGDDRVVLPIGSTEQHAYLSLETDNILAERIATEAAEPLGVPVLPVLPYGVTPLFAAYPGSPSLRVGTYVAVLRDLLDSLYGQGFRRFLLVNGHGGNSFARAAIGEWNAAHADGQALWHDWWNSAAVAEACSRVESVWSHASWSENFPWTRLEGVDFPAERKESLLPLPPLDAAGYRRAAGDGSVGGAYAMPDDVMLEIWRLGVEEARALLESGWRQSSAG
jgi:creatinine amidohydrolase